MEIIALTGDIGHGKTTLADALADLEKNSIHLESSEIIIEVVNALHAELTEPINFTDFGKINHWLSALPDILRDVVHEDTTFEKIRARPVDMMHETESYQTLFTHLRHLEADFSMAQTKITAENKSLYRPMLQWIGGYMVEHVDEGIWFNEVVRRARIAEELGKTLCVVGGLRYPAEEQIMRAVDAAIVEVFRPGHGRIDASDPTERERKLITPDTIVKNNGTVKALRQVAPRLLRDIKADQLKPDYTAVGPQSWYVPNK